MGGIQPEVWGVDIIELKLEGQILTFRKKKAGTIYLYFVSKNNGTHKFSTILREHNRAVYTFQKKIKELFFSYQERPFIFSFKDTISAPKKCKYNINAFNASDSSSMS